MNYNITNLNYVDKYGSHDYVNIEEIVKLGQLTGQDIQIQDGGNFITHMLPLFDVYVKNNFIGKKNGFFINKLYSHNNLPIPDNFTKYTKLYYVNQYEPPSIVTLNDAVLTGGGTNYYLKYIKYKKKYNNLKSLLLKRHEP